jgi:hypothetical protein
MAPDLSGLGAVPYGAVKYQHRNEETMVNRKFLLGMAVLALGMAVLGCSNGTTDDTGNGKDGGGLGFTITAPVYSEWTSSTDNTPYTGSATVEVRAFTGEDNDWDDQTKYHPVPGASAVITNGTLTLVLTPFRLHRRRNVSRKNLTCAVSEFPL